MSNKLTIWDSRREKTQTDFEWTKELINEILDAQVQKEKEKLNQEDKVKSLFELKVMPIEDIKVDSLKSFPSGYESTNYWGQTYQYLTVESIENRCQQGLKDIELILASAEKQHQKNIPAIENNTQIVDGIDKLMQKFGIKRTYSEYTYKSSRSRTKDWITQSCQWPLEVLRFIKKTDSYQTIVNQCDAQRKKIEEWKVKKLKELEEVQKVKQQEEQKLLETRLLAQMQVKYGLGPTTDWQDVRDVLLNKNKYLHLAYWLERNRGDWNDGYSYADTGLDGFSVETETDKLIYYDIQSYIDDWEGDGRVFRDCEWNYSVLYGMVDDEELMKDFNDIRNYID
jgi:hypothetical protein